jgi:phosphoribosylanthranilate isomerase
MSVQIKFCGLTRVEDVAVAEDCGAAYVGVVFAGGPRKQSSSSAAQILANVRAAKRVGVVAMDDTANFVSLAANVPLDILQLHADPSLESIQNAKSLVSAKIWTVVRIDNDHIPADLKSVFRLADAVVLDTRVANGLGGSGRTFDWAMVADHIAAYRGETTLVVAGGLTPDNVGEAVRALRPAVVDVSSGVESAPGIKDHHLMRRFAEAVHAAQHSDL